MNIYLLGINAGDNIYQSSKGQIYKLFEELPQLDYENIWSFSEKNIFCYSVHTSNKACFPKEYICENEKEILLYDGFIIDALDNKPLIKPEDIILNWQRKATDFEGQFSIIRINKKTSSIMLVTDFIGMGQVYYYRDGNTWLISNHIGILQKILKLKCFDNYGVSLLLTMGWIAGKHTLTEGIYVVPGGHIWKWYSLENKLEMENYYPIRKCKQNKQKSRFGINEATLLSDKLVNLCSAAKASGRKLYCPITGGRDSRVILSLLIRGGIKGIYFIDGNSSSEEGKIAQEIASKYELPYHNHQINLTDLERRWDELCRTLIVQNHGMVSLWQVCDILRQKKKIDKTDVLLSGFGGEIGRRFYKNPTWFIGKHNLKSVSRNFSKRLFRNYGGIVKKAAMSLSNDFITKWAESVLQDGIPPTEIPDYFYAFERVRRWAGSNLRKMTPEIDVFSPFCSRPFVEMAFSLIPVYRYSEPLHYGMLSLIPNLHQMCFENGTWNSQLPWINLLQITIKKYTNNNKKVKSGFIPTLDRVQFLKQNLLKVRDVCLDQAHSELWQFIDKDLFEEITSKKLGSIYIEDNAEIIYQIATLFYYQNFCLD